MFIYRVIEIPELGRHAHVYQVHGGRVSRSSAEVVWEPLYITNAPGQIPPCRPSFHDHFARFISSTFAHSFKCFPGHEMGSQLPSEVVGPAGGVLFYSFVCLLAGSFLLFLVCAHNEWMSCTCGSCSVLGENETETDQQQKMSQCWLLSCVSAQPRPSRSRYIRYDGGKTSKQTSTPTWL